MGATCAASGDLEDGGAERIREVDGQIIGLYADLDIVSTGAGQPLVDVLKRLGLRDDAVAPDCTEDARVLACDQLFHGHEEAGLALPLVARDADLQHVGSRDDESRQLRGQIPAVVSVVSDG